MTDPAAEPTADDSTTLRVRTELRSAILEGEYRPGTRLRAAAVAERFSASRTPAREALLLLAWEGLLDIVPRRGAVVRSTTIDDVVDLYEIRARLEPHGAAKAATRISDDELALLERLCAEQHEIVDGTNPDIERLISSNAEFHDVVMRASGSSAVIGAVANAGAVPLTVRQALWSDADFRRQAVLHHEELVRALRRRDSALSESVMTVHLRHAMSELTRRSLLPKS